MFSATLLRFAGRVVVVGGEVVAAVVPGCEVPEVAVVLGGAVALAAPVVLVVLLRGMDEEELRERACSSAPPTSSPSREASTFTLRDKAPPKILAIPRASADTPAVTKNLRRVLPVSVAKASVTEPASVAGMAFSSPESLLRDLA